MTPGEALTELRRLADKYRRGELTTDEWVDAAERVLSQVATEW